MRPARTADTTDPKLWRAVAAHLTEQSNRYQQRIATSHPALAKELEDLTPIISSMLSSNDSKLWEAAARLITEKIKNTKATTGVPDDTEVPDSKYYSYGT